MSRATNHHAYYVTAIIDGGTGNQRTAWLVGPFETHREALRMVTPARRLIRRKSDDPRFAFAAFGTAKRTHDRTEPFPPGSRYYRSEPQNNRLTTYHMRVITAATATE